MASPTVQRDDALRSALNRLNVPILVCNGAQQLEPLNALAVKMFELENLRGDLLTTRPSHPLSRFIADILRSDSGEMVSRRLVTFPSGRKYTIESSGRSQKGPRRLLIVLLEPVREISLDAESALERWPLTGRQREVAMRVARGLSNDAIARDMGISAETVKTHVRNIFEKCGTHSRAEFLAAVLRTK